MPYTCFVGIYIKIEKAEEIAMIESILPKVFGGAEAFFQKGSASIKKEPERALFFSASQNRLQRRQSSKIARLFTKSKRPRHFLLFLVSLDFLKQMDCLN